MIVRFKPLLKITLSLALVFSFALSGAFAYNIGDPFIDNDEITNDDFFLSHVTSLLDNNFITGEIGENKVPTGEFHPTDNINRAEFSKITAINRFAEDIGEENGWEDMTYGRMESELRDIFHPYYKCTSSICFPDVKGKEPECDKGKGCDPWFTQYINYLAGKGIVSGKDDGKFYPGENILRIHAFKMLMTDNGKAPLSQNQRYQDLLKLTESRNSTKPDCLVGAETEILKGNNTKLLSYALLADRLDFFGNDCRLLKSPNGIRMSSIGIANYLNAPITREEVTRFLALSSFYEPIAVNPKKDDTVNTGWQNWRTDSDDDYQMPDASYDETKFVDPNNPLARQVVQDEQDKDEGFIGPVHESEDETEEDSKPKFDTYPDSSCSGDYGPYMRRTHYGDPIDLERSGTHAQVNDYIHKMERDNLDDSEIDNWLKQCGLWEVVEDERGEDEEYSIEDEIIKNLNDYSDSDTHSELDACVRGILPKTQGSDNFNIVLDWCIAQGIGTAEIEKEAYIKIAKELSNHYRYSRNIENTRDYVYADAQINSLRRFVVNAWYAWKVDYMKTFSLIGGYEAYGQVVSWKWEWNMDNGPSPWKIVGEDKTIPFALDNGNTFNFKRSSDYKNTYILIHGWKGGPEGWPKQMAENINNYDKDAQIILLDWKKIAGQYLFTDGLLSLLKIPQNPGVISKWTMPIVNVIDYPLVDWNIKGGKTTIIGHSLGAFIAKQLAEKVGTQVNTIYLDPAAFPVKYRLEFGEDPIIMDSFDHKGACFRADDNLLGSKDLVKECKETYLIEYDNPNGNSIATEAEKIAGVKFTIETVNAIEKKILEGVIPNVVFEVVNGDLIMNLSAYINGEKTVIGTASGMVLDAALVDIPCILAAKGAPVLVSACNVALGTVVDLTIKEIIAVAKKKHSWVYETYSEITYLPFNNEYLDPQDIYSRAKGGTNLNIQKNIFGDGVDGVVYTERHSPTALKYLKVIENNTSNYYTLYGNNADNALECAEGMWDFSGESWKDCIMYGGNGNDEFTLDPYVAFRTVNNSLIKDFKKNNDSDKIIIESYNEESFGSTNLEVVMDEFNGKTVPAIKVTCGICNDADGEENDYGLAMNRAIYLDNSSNYDFWKVWIWVDKAVYSGNYKESELEDNPIIVQ